MIRLSNLVVVGQFRLANERWAQDYDELQRNTSGTGSEREKELEERLKTEKNNYELLRGKYNLLEQTMKEERDELVGLRRELHLAQQQRSSEDMTSTVGEMQQVVSYVISCFEGIIHVMKYDYVSIDGTFYIEIETDIITTLMDIVMVML